MQTPSLTVAMNANCERRTYSFCKDEIRFGRHPNNEVQITHYRVARSHAMMRWDGERWLLQPHSTGTGTFRNGVRIQDEVPVPVASGDKIRLGDVEVEIGFSTTSASDDSISPEDSPTN